jgi:hypothetical protein
LLIDEFVPPSNAVIKLNSAAGEVTDMLPFITVQEGWVTTIAKRQLSFLK